MEKKPNYMTVPTALKELEKIEKTEADVIAAKKRCDHATAGLKELLEKSKYLLCESKLHCPLGRWNLEIHFRNKTPVYNFINNRLVDESAVLKPL